MPPNGSTRCLWMVSVGVKMKINKWYIDIWTQLRLRILAILIFKQDNEFFRKPQIFWRYFLSLNEGLEGVCKVKNFAWYFLQGQKICLHLLQGHKIQKGHKVTEKMSARSAKYWIEISKVILFRFKNCKVPIGWEVTRSRKKNPQGHENIGQKSARSFYFA